MPNPTYPARVHHRGKVLHATFIDFPEAVTQSESAEELKDNCVTVLERILSDFMRRKRTIPRASSAAGVNILHISVSPAFARKMAQYVVDRQGEISTI